MERDARQGRAERHAEGHAEGHPLAVARGDDRLLWDLHASEQYLFWLAAADDMGLFTALAAAPTSAEEIATQFAIGLVAAEGLLGVLAALGLLVSYDARFSLTQTARDFLLPSSPYYRGSWLEGVRRRPRVTYDMVYAALRDSQPTHPHYWESAATDPAQSAFLVRGLHSLLFAGGPALAERGDFAGVQRLLDVGGGAGGMSIALARHYPTLHCTVLDHEVACAIAAEYSTVHGVDRQVDTLPLNALVDPWPTDYDAVLFSHMLDCFDDTHCRLLVQKAYACLPPGGRLYIHEMLLNDAKTGPLGVMALSLYDHLGSRGQQWTAGEVKAMLVSAGFVALTVTPTYGYNALIWATKP